MAFVGVAVMALFIGVASAKGAPTFSDVIIASNEAAFDQNVTGELVMSLELTIPIFTEENTTMIDVAAEGTSTMHMNADDESFMNRISGNVDVRIDGDNTDQDTTFSIDGGVDLIVIEDDLYMRESAQARINGIPIPFLITDEQDIWKHEELDIDEDSIIEEITMLSNEYSVYMEEILDMIPVDIVLENGKNVGGGNTMYDISVDMSELKELAQEEIDYTQEGDNYFIDDIEEKYLELAEQALDTLKVYGAVTVDNDDVMQEMSVVITAQADDAHVHMQFSSAMTIVDNPVAIIAPITR